MRLRLFQCGAEDVPGHEVTEERLCDAVVIDLNRRPSRGKEVAIALRGAKSTRHIPIVFVEGAPEKVEAIRQLLPDAVYTIWPKLPAALKKLRPVANPVVPKQMMDRYMGRTTAQKLGIKESSTVTVVNPPRNYAQVLGEMPPNVEIVEGAGTVAPVTVCFAHDREALPEILDLGRRIADKTKFWICWQKGKKTGFNDIPIRNSAVALGLVDYKVCSLDSTWSGMVFALKKS
jgi:CheY-like chemotaxis protein